MLYCICTHIIELDPTRFLEPQKSCCGFLFNQLKFMQALLTKNYFTVFPHNFHVKTCQFHATNFFYGGRNVCPCTLKPAVHVVPNSSCAVCCVGASLTCLESLSSRRHEAAAAAAAMMSCCSPQFVYLGGDGTPDD